MSDAYNFIYSDDPRTGALTYPQLEARRKIAIALATRNRPYPKTIGEGLTALGEGLGEGMYNARTARDETAYQKQSDADVQRLTGQSVTPAAPRPAPGGASLDSEQATQAYAMVPPDAEKVSQKPQMDVEELVQRYARNESGGAKDPYSLVGHVSRRGDYPYGKYQVMGRNIPGWTAQYLGKEMTPQEFLSDKQAQEDLARARGGELLAKYGPDGAAAAWFAGEKGMHDPKRRDALGTNVTEYVRRFNTPLGEQMVASAARLPAAARPTAFASEAPVQVASLGGDMPTPDTARDAIAQSLIGQQQPAQPQQPQAQPPVQVAQAPQQQQFNRPPTPPAQQGPPPMPDQTPMTQQEMNIRRAIGASADPTFRGRLEPFAERMEAERKFKDAQNMKLWEKDVAAYEKRTDPLYQQQLKKAQQDIIIDAQAPPADPRVLGTPQSPQRTGIPTTPPPPPGVTPAKWAELQAPEHVKTVKGAEKATPQFNDMVDLLNQAKTHPGREWGVGFTSSIARNTPGTSAFGFGAIMDQIGGKNFLAAYESLKGAGQISEIEGTKAEAAQARLKTAQTKEDFDKAMHDFENVIRRDFENVQRKMNMPVTAWKRGPDDPQFAPDINQIGVRGGKNVKYIGGDPAEDTSYQVVR